MTPVDEPPQPAENAAKTPRGWSAVALAIWQLPGTVLILLVRGYQVFLGPMLGAHCRFHPSCSNYFIQAVRKYGAVVGTWKGLCRICRCHPFHPGGYDPP